MAYIYSDMGFEQKMSTDFGKILEDNPPKKALIRFKRKEYRRRIYVNDAYGIYVRINSMNVRVR